MSTMTIDCAPELAVALGRREADLEKELRLASALKLFELGRISSGLAARLAGMDRVEFLLCLEASPALQFDSNISMSQKISHNTLVASDSSNNVPESLIPTY